MADPRKKTHALFQELHRLMKNESSLHFNDFAEVSDALMEGYTRFACNGLPGHTVALAMLGATVNVYTMFGMEDELPGLLRALADLIEGEVWLS